MRRLVRRFCLLLRSSPRVKLCEVMSSPLIITAFGLVILCQISAIASADTVVPVLISGKNSDSFELANPLVKTSPNEFGEIIAKKVGGSQLPIVVFEKKNLCVEELSQQKLDLSIFGDWHYLPAVESPSYTLDNLPFYNSSTEEKPETITNRQLITIPINDLNNVAESYKNLLASNPNVIAIITGSYCEYTRSERTRRAVASRVDEDELVVYSDRILFYSGSGLYVKKAATENFTLINAPTSYSTVVDGTNISLVLVYNTTAVTTNELTLRVQFSVKSTGYWYLDSVEYETDSITQTLEGGSVIYFPFNFSYHCSENAIFSYNETYLNITHLQVQIDPAVTNTTVTFSDGYDCVGFTTVPIWSGIFITFILGLIMIWAITMILDIRTMDRFDDPKGKTITIAGAD